MMFDLSPDDLLSEGSVKLIARRQKKDKEDVRDWLRERYGVKAESAMSESEDSTDDESLQRVDDLVAKFDEDSSGSSDSDSNDTESSESEPNLSSQEESTDDSMSDSDSESEARVRVRRDRPRRRKPTLRSHISV